MSATPKTKAPKEDRFSLQSMTGETSEHLLNAKANFS
jgi:hypothetical protein